MFRSMLLAFGAAAMLTGTASAQVVIGGAGALPKARKAQLDKIAELEIEVLKGILDPEFQPFDPDALKKLQPDPEMLKKLLEINPNGLNGQPGKPGIGGAGGIGGIGGMGGIGGGGQLQWADMRLKRPSAEEQRNLGLPDNEGQQIVSVAPGSTAEKAGLKANDIIVKIDNKAAPSDHVAFAKLVKDHDAAMAMDIVVVREGKEEVIKAASMPLMVQSIGSGRGINGFNGLMFKALGPRNLPPPGFKNGERINRRNNNETFSGESIKDGVIITVTGKMDNGKPMVTEITVAEVGKEAKTYTKIDDVPEPHRAVVPRLLPRPPLFQFPTIPFGPEKQ